MEVFPLRPSAYLCVLCVNGPFNAESRRDTQRPQRNKSDLPLFVQSPSDSLCFKTLFHSHQALAWCLCRGIMKKPF